MSKTYVVVGASTGLGQETARILARANRVIVCGRDVERVIGAVPGAKSAVRVDLTDLRDVERAAFELRALGPIDGLVCNAGVQHTGAPAFTRDGFEETFAVNHLAHFAMVMHLARDLAPGARVAFIGSGTLDPADRGARRFGFRGGQYTDAHALARGDGDPAVDEAQRARDRYATSKLCNLLAMAAIARRVPAERFATFALDPGVMPGTNLARQYSAVQRFLWHTLLRGVAWAMPGASSARCSGEALAWLMTAPELAGSTSRYFDYRREEIVGWYGQDRVDWGEDLYASSLALCGIAGDPLRATAAA
jgi:NAD(P)-dependent dehydrogenase (short-subunit alcohol dehydrogenase family)